MGTNLKIIITSENSRDSDTYTGDALFDVWRDYALYDQIRDLPQFSLKFGVSVTLPGSIDDTLNSYCDGPIKWVTVSDLAGCTDFEGKAWNRGVWAFLKCLPDGYIAFLWWDC